MSGPVRNATSCPASPAALASGTSGSTCPAAGVALNRILNLSPVLTLDSRPLSRETAVLAAAVNGEDKPASWHVQTGKDPVLPLFCENVAECLARVIDIGEDAAAMQLL